LQMSKREKRITKKADDNWGGKIDGGREVLVATLIRGSQIGPMGNRERRMSKGEGGKVRGVDGGGMWEWGGGKNQSIAR